METRNIQKTGGSSFLTTLPKTWITKNKLEENGKLDIYERTKFIVLKPSRKKYNNRFKLDISKLDDNKIVSEIIGMYISGADEIVIKSKNFTYKERQLIRKVSHKLIGFELFDESSDKVLLKNVSNPIITVKEYLKRMLDIIFSMLEDTIKAVEKLDYKIARDIIERDVEIDRINLVIVRNFHHRLHEIVSENDQDLPLTKLHYFEHVSIRLERIADHLVRIAETVETVKKPEHLDLNKFEMANLKKLKEYLECVKHIIISNCKNECYKLLDMYESYRKNPYINKPMVKKPSANILVSASVDRIRSYGANIAEETINFTNFKHDC